MMTRTLGHGYFALQAVAGAAWWLGVFTLAPVRRATLGELPPLLVAAGDLPLFVAASALVALGVRWAVWVVVPWTLFVTALMAVYATATGLAGWGAVLMLAAAAGGVAAGLLVQFGRIPTERLLVGPFAFRSADPAPARRHLTRTIGQLVAFWVLFLVMFPAVIAWGEWRWGLRLEPSIVLQVATADLGVIVLVAASALGVWSAVAMSTAGAGTPLPSDTAAKLVVVGPYRWVRNPMAVAGIVQAIAVGLIAGSWLVVVYAVAGSLVWNWGVRPHEEADLEARFGGDYDAYRARVACWVPRMPANAAG